MSTTFRRLATAGLTALCALALNTGIAHASIGVIGEFGTTGVGALEAGHGSQGSAAGLEGVAANPLTGDVYAADGGHYRVVEFSPSGEFILSFGREVNKTKVEKGASEAEENVCTAASGDECQAGVEGTGPDQFSGPATESGPLGVAVGLTGDVYVVDGNAFGSARVEKFSATGAYISQIESDVGNTPAYSGACVGVDLEGNLYVCNFFGSILKFDSAGVFTGLSFGTSFPESVAVDPSGFIYASERGPLSKFNPAGEFVEALESNGRVAVDLANGEVFTGSPDGNEILEYGPSGSLTGSFPSVGGGQLAYSPGVGELYERVGNGIVAYGTFPAPAPEAPTVARESASNVGVTTATIHAAVNPKSLDTTYDFQYGTSPTLAGAATAPIPSADAGSGFFTVAVSVNLTGLQGSARYYYRVVAHNAFGGGGGSSAEGPIQSFVTLPPPAVVTTGEPSVGTRSATLSGVIVPGSVGVESDTRWCFQYGQTSAYEMGFLPEVAADDLGQGTSGVPVSVQLGSLRPGTTYHYRLVAVNALVGESLGSVSCEIVGGQEVASPDRTFTTSPPPAPVVDTGAASGVSQNLAVVSGTVDPGGSQVFYEFDLGTDTTYGSRVFGEVGSQMGAQSLTVSFGGLTPGTVYHYRLVASGPGGTTYGADRTFTTGVFPTATLSEPAVEPLLATPTVAFPMETAETATVKAKRKAKGRSRRKSKRKAEKASRAVASDRPHMKGRGK